MSVWVLLSEPKTKSEIQTKNSKSSRQLIILNIFNDKQIGVLSKIKKNINLTNKLRANNKNKKFKLNLLYKN